MIFETAQLRTLVAIVETGSFTKAAAKVNLTQPAVSLHIKRLEDQVMRKILDRDGRRVAAGAYGSRRQNITIPKSWLRCWRISRGSIRR